MKIILVGEFSGFFKNLRDGLQELGHDAIIAASRDGYKKIDVDVDLGSDLIFPFGKLASRVKPLSFLRQMSGYDVVQFVNPYIFGARYSFNNAILRKLCNCNDKAFLSAAGSDSFFWRVGRQHLKYGPFEETLKYDYKKKRHFLESDAAYNWNSELAGMVNGVIPVMHEYAVSYAHVKTVRRAIPLPMNVHKIPFSENAPSKKLVIFHGLTRYGFKGTRYVEAAFDELRKRYPNDLELIIDGRMPLHRYLDVMARANVVVDQVLSYSCGMNALYALAMGKVVLGGAEKESLELFGLSKSPVINIRPDEKSIIAQVEALLDKRSSIADIGLESRSFVEAVHGHVGVAQQYIDQWSL